MYIKSSSQTVRSGVYQWYRFFLIPVGEGIKIEFNFGTRRDKVLKAFVKCPSV